MVDWTVVRLSERFCWAISKSFLVWAFSACNCLFSTSRALIFISFFWFNSRSWAISKIWVSWFFSSYSFFLRIYSNCCLVSEMDNLNWFFVASETWTSMRCLTNLDNCFFNFYDSYNFNCSIFLYFISQQFTRSFNFLTVYFSSLFSWITFRSNL